MNQVEFVESLWVVRRDDRSVRAEMRRNGAGWEVRLFSDQQWFAAHRVGFREQAVVGRQDLRWPRRGRMGPGVEVDLRAWGSTDERVIVPSHTDRTPSFLPEATADQYRTLDAIKRHNSLRQTVPPYGLSSSI